MGVRIEQLEVRNFRCLARVSVPLTDVNVFFGPNGAGKSSLLDTVWFIRDCAIRGVGFASADRNHGIGLLYDEADDGALLEVSLSNGTREYRISCGLASGRIEPFAGELLRSIDEGRVLIERRVGSDAVSMCHSVPQSSIPITLREPEKLSLGTYLSFEANDSESAELDQILRFARNYRARSFRLEQLQRRGSEAGYETRLFDRCENAWSVLRNLHDRRSVDDRFDTILEFMSEAFPSFDGLLLEPTGPNAVYLNFLEKGRRREIRASGVSDGHLQLLLLLTALFSEGHRPSVLMFDEPEISLHPWALAVFAKAVRRASIDFAKQVLIVTHSPVLLSQFDPSQIVAAGLADGQTHLSRLSDDEEIRNLLEQYAAGSLFMAETIGPQSREAAGVEAIIE